MCCLKPLCNYTYAKTFKKQKLLILLVFIYIEGHTFFSFPHLWRCKGMLRNSDIRAFNIKSAFFSYRTELSAVLGILVTV